jgi:hypothetical protein
MSNLDESIITLHRYFIWANRMRIHFEEIVARNSGIITNTKDFLINSTLYMSYWYAGLYVVIEGWTGLKLHDTVIDELVKSPNVALLKRYRHGVFHFQKKYNDTRFREFIEQGEKPVEWVRQLTSELSRWFIDRFNSPRAAQPVVPADRATRGR